MMRALIMSLLAVGLVAPVAAQDAKPRVIARAAGDAKTGIGNVRLIQSSKGDLLAFYTVGPTVFVTASKDAGATWTDLVGKRGAAMLSEDAFGGFDVCLGATDRVIVAVATRNTIKLRTLTRTDAGWVLSGAKKLDAALRVREPSVCRDTQGDVWVGYWFGGHEGMQGIRVSRTSSGERFGERTGRYNIAWGFFSSVQQLAAQRGRPMIFYSGGTPWESVQLYWSTFNGKQWHLPRIGLGACMRSPGTFTVLIDDSDSLILAWRTFPGQQHVRLRRRDASGKWDAEATDLDGAGRFSRPALVTDGRRTWVLHGRTASDELVVTPLTAKGVGKRVVVKSPLASVALVSPGRIAPDARAVPVVWTSTPGRKPPAKELYFATVDLGGR